MSRQVEKGLIIKAETKLNEKQIQRFYAQTPKEKIKTRPAKGGGFWKFVAGSYVIQTLNSLFGPDGWSFEITTSMTEALATANTGTIVVAGRLSIHAGDRVVVREQYGRKDVAYRVEIVNGKKQRVKDDDGRDVLLDFGNDLKAAGTDALKKCASQLGLFADVYTQEDFFEATIIDSDVPRERRVSNKWVPSDNKLMSTNQKEILNNQLRQRHLEDSDEINNWMWDNYGVGFDELTEAQAQRVIEDLNEEYKESLKEGNNDQA